MIGGVEVRHLRDTNYELESQIAQLHKDVQEKDAQLMKEKRSLDEVPTSLLFLFVVLFIDALVSVMVRRLPTTPQTPMLV